MCATVRKPDVLLTPRDTLTINSDPSSIVEFGALVYTLALELGPDICNMLKGCYWMQTPKRPIRDRLVSSCLESPSQVRTPLADEDIDNAEQRLLR